MPTNSFLLGDIWRPIRRRTQAAYIRLFKQPNYLFGRGSRTTIFPNGAREIWISNADGTASFAITASNGPAGFGVTIRAAVGTLAADAHVMTRADYRTRITEDVREISFTAYYLDEYAQAFRTWYKDDSTDRVHPDQLGLTPRVVPAEAVDNPNDASSRNDWLASSKR